MSDEYDEEYNDDKNADQNAWMYVCDEESRLVYSPMIETRAPLRLTRIGKLPHVFFFACGNWPINQSWLLFYL